MGEPRQWLRWCAAVVCFLALSVSGCQETEYEPELGGVSVTAAHLEGLEIVAVGMMYTVFDGSAIVVATESSGAVWEVPINIQGAAFGMFFDTSIALAVRDELPLGLPQSSIDGASLFGRYRGSYKSLIIPIGAQVHDTSNSQGVEFRRAVFAVGMGMTGAAEYLDFLPSGDATQR